MCILLMCTQYKIYVTVLLESILLLRTYIHNKISVLMSSSKTLCTINVTTNYGCETLYENNFMEMHSSCLELVTDSKLPLVVCIKCLSQHHFSHEWLYDAISITGKAFPYNTQSQYMDKTHIFIFTTDIVAQVQSWCVLTFGSIIQCVYEKF